MMTWTEREILNPFAWIIFCVLSYICFRKIYYYSGLCLIQYVKMTPYGVTKVSLVLLAAAPIIFLILQHFVLAGLFFFALFIRCRHIQLILKIQKELLKRIEKIKQTKEEK